MAGVVFDGLTVLEDLLKLGKPIEATLSAVRAGLVALREGIDGKTSPQVVLLQIESLRDSLAENDANADSALDKRFPT